MRIVKKGLWLIVLVPVLFIANSGFLSSPGDKYFEISKNLDIFGKMFREVNSFYVDDVDATKLMRTGIDAMLGSLDPYTNYISAGEIEDYRFMSTGQYGGIGATIGKRDGKVIVTEPYENEPAQKAGILAGDVIIQIDGERVDNVKSETIDVRNLLRGQPKTPVKIVVMREGVDKPLEFEVMRDDIKILNVPYSGMIDQEIGYISLTGFTHGAANEVKQAYEKLKRENPGIKGLVLDLRGNPGGLLNEAVDISNIFVNQGEKIVETRGKIESSRDTYFARHQPVDTEMPLAVLINRRSASASEIVSGVIQDLDRGVIVGQRSFGKGLVQTTRPLSFNSQMKITTAKYYIPSGRCIQAIDYANRNEDGSVGKIPDSLRREFKTKRGRLVYDGGGVSPDVTVELPEYHPVTQQLIAQNILFDYATRYRLGHTEIANARQFAISDDIYRELKAFASQKKFTFETQSEKELTKFEDMLKDEAYHDELQAELAAIRQKIGKEKEEDMDTFRKEISDFLKTEIIRRYYYRSGEIEASFDMDPDLLQAIQVLKDPTRYKKLLGN